MSLHVCVFVCFGGCAGRESESDLFISCRAYSKDRLHKWELSYLSGTSPISTCVSDRVHQARANTHTSPSLSPNSSVPYFDTDTHAVAVCTENHRGIGRALEVCSWVGMAEWESHLLVPGVSTDVQRSAPHRSVWLRDQKTTGCSVSRQGHSLCLCHTEWFRIRAKTPGSLAFTSINLLSYDEHSPVSLPHYMLPAGLSLAFPTIYLHLISVSISSSSPWVFVLSSETVTCFRHLVPLYLNSVSSEENIVSFGFMTFSSSMVSFSLECKPLLWSI